MLYIYLIIKFVRIHIFGHITKPCSSRLQLLIHFEFLNLQIDSAYQAPTVQNSDTRFFAFLQSIDISLDISVLSISTKSLVSST